MDSTWSIKMATPKTIFANPASIQVYLKMAAHPAASLRYIRQRPIQDGSQNYKMARTYIFFQDGGPSIMYWLKNGRPYYTTLHRNRRFKVSRYRIDPSVRMNVKPEAERCLVDGTTRESRKYVTGAADSRQDNVLCITVIIDHHRLKKSIASHMNNIFKKYNCRKCFIHRGSKEAHLFAHARHKKTTYKGTPTEAEHALQGK